MAKKTETKNTVHFEHQDKAVSILKIAQERVLGNEGRIDVAVGCICAKADVMFEGPPGIAKTVLGKLFSGAFKTIPAEAKPPGGDDTQKDMFNEGSAVPKFIKDRYLKDCAISDIRTYARFQCTSDTMADDYSGTLDLGHLQRKGIETPRPRYDILRSLLCHVDEVNRAPSQPQSGWLTMMEEQIAFIRSFKVDVVPKLYIFTRNPASRGTFEMAEALLDRIQCVIPFNYISGNQLRKSAALKDNFEVPNLGTVVDLMEMWEEVEKVIIPADVDMLMSYSVRATQCCQYGVGEDSIGSKADLGENFPGCCNSCDYKDSDNICKEVFPASPRSYYALQRVARGYAYVNGRDTVTVEDVKKVLPFVLKVQTVGFDPKNPNKLSQRIDICDRIFGMVEEVPTFFEQAAKGNIETKKLEELAKGGNFIYEEIAPELEEVQAEAQAGDIKKYRTMTVDELRLKLKAAPKKRRYVIELMVAQTANVMGAVTIKDLKSEAFQQAFTTPEGEPLLAGEQWDTLRMKGKVKTEDLITVELEKDADNEGKGNLTFRFPKPEFGEPFHAHFESIDGFNLYPRYHLIEDKLQDVGI